MITLKARLIFIVLFLLTFFSFPMFSYASGIMTGRVAPSFEVVSADKQVLTLDDIKGKVAVLFYESKDAIEQNRKLKNALNIFYAKQPDSVKKDIIRIGVINCRGVFFRGEWEKGLRDNSLKEGITIYGDWDGKMQAAYQAKTGVSNPIIIDRNGVIRYDYSGQVKDKDIVLIEDLLKSLL